MTSKGFAHYGRMIIYNVTVDACGELHLKTHWCERGNASLISAWIHSTLFSPLYWTPCCQGCVLWKELTLMLETERIVEHLIYLKSWGNPQSSAILGPGPWGSRKSSPCYSHFDFENCKVLDPDRNSLNRPKFRVRIPWPRGILMIGDFFFCMGGRGGVTQWFSGSL